MSDKMGPFDPDKISLPPQLETDRLIMVPVGEEDFDFHWECNSDPVVMAHFPTVADDKAECLEDFKAKFFVDGYFKFFYAVSLKDEAGLSKNDNRTNTIATVLLRPYKNGTEMELGYMASPRVWGKGIVPEASTRVLNHGFDDMGLDYAIALISKGNEKSERVVEKLGFKFSELVTDDVRFPELNKFVLTREVWVREAGAREAKAREAKARASLGLL